MEELPDDLVLRIFSMLGADMLLGAVPVVCKRWATLARHPDAWRNVEVYLHLSDDSQREKAMRVLRLAPHLNAIYFNDLLFPSRSRVERFTEELLKGRLTSLKKLMTLPTSTKHMRAQIAKILAKFENSLREVQLVVRWPLECDVVSVTTAKDLCRLVQRIASLPRMTSLQFDFDGGDLDLHLKMDCFAPLSRGCPALRKVTVLSGSLTDDISRMAVLHAIRGKLLTELDLGSYTPHHSEVFAAVAECKSLTKFSCCVEYLPAIKDMTSLRRLTLYFPMNSIPFSPIVDDVQACPVLSSITELTINRNGGELDLGVYQFVKSLSEKCGNVVQLSFQSWSFVDLEMFESVLNCWPNLNCLAIIDCEGIKPSVINNLCSLERLKTVILKTLLAENRNDENELIAAVKSLKQQRQDVCIDLVPCDNPWLDYDDDDDDDYANDFYDDYQFTYFDYLRNKYGEDLADEDLYGLMSSDEDGDYVLGMF